MRSSQQLEDVLTHVNVPDLGLQTLFERLHGIGYAQAAQKDMDEMRSEMAAMLDELGVDIDIPELRPGMSEEEIAIAADQVAEECAKKSERVDSSRCARTASGLSTSAS